MTLFALDDAKWRKVGKREGWLLPPPVSWPWRLPVIRHVRAIHHSWRVMQHNDLWRSLGSIPTGYDEWCLYGMWRGFW